MKRKYKGITFAEGYNRPFADFINEFGSTHIFKRLRPDDRKKELRKAWKIATDGNIKKTVGKVTGRKRSQSKPRDI